MCYVLLPSVHSQHKGWMCDVLLPSVHSPHKGWMCDVLLPSLIPYTQVGYKTSYFPVSFPTHREDVWRLTSQGSILHTGWIRDVLLPRAHSPHTGWIWDVLLPRAQSYTQGAVADLGFSWGAPTPKAGLFFQLFAKNCMKMKEFGPGGGAHPWHPALDLPMGWIWDVLLPRAHSLHTGWIRDVLLPRAQSYTQGGYEMSYFPGLNPTHRVDLRRLTSQGSILHTGWIWDVLLPRAHSLHTGWMQEVLLPRVHSLHTGRMCNVSHPSIPSPHTGWMCGVLLPSIHSVHDGRPISDLSALISFNMDF